jgi:hypothetical protein
VGDCCGEGVIEAHEDDEYDQEGTRLRPLRRASSRATNAGGSGDEEQRAPDGYGHEGAEAPHHAGEALKAPDAAVDA